MTNELDKKQVSGSKIFRVYLSKDDLSSNVNIFGDGYQVHDGGLFIFVGDGKNGTIVASFYHWVGIVESPNLARYRDVQGME